MIRIPKIALALTFANLVLLVYLVTQTNPTANAQNVPGAAQTIRCRGLEVVDDQGRVRASLTVEPPIVVDGKQYPETVLFRMRDAEGPPRMKFAANKDGVGLHLVGDSKVRLDLRSNDTSFLKLTDAEGKEQFFKQ